MKSGPRVPRPALRQVGRMLFCLGAAASVLLRVPLSARAAACLQDGCHADFAATASPHGFDAEGGCEACHVRTRESHPVEGVPGFRLTAPVPALCAECHDGVVPDDSTHPPAADGECLTCHRVHGAEGPMLVDVERGDQRPLCLGCHDAAPFEQEHLHGPAAVGACSECHDVHGGSRKALLRADSPELCYRCHRDFEAAVHGAETVHEPLRSGPCSACHGAHGGPYPSLLLTAAPDLCFQCHEDIRERFEKARTKHAPLYRSTGCGTCHEVHAANESALLREPEQDLCLSADCHGRTDTRRSIPLRNIAEEIRDREHQHGPVAEGRCAVCHDPHGSDEFRMLTGRYPATFYAPYQPETYGLCLGCHEKNLLRFPDTTLYTAFRDGKINLHHTHVADRRKGRSCRACHEPHASSAPMLIAEDGARFGDWNIPIFFVKTESGGSCTPGCHRTLGYDRESPRSARPAPPR